jgi:very-short-patch-repair endonuclease
MKNLSMVRNFTPEYRKKISDTLKSKGIKPPSRKGVKMSLAWRKRRSDKFKKLGIGKWMKGKKWDYSGMGKKGGPASRKSQAGKNGLTNIERIIDEYLHFTKIKHEHEFAIGQKVVDFYLPETYEILEADSVYWHKNKDEEKRDKYIEERMRGVRMIHLKEEFIKNGKWLNIWGAKRKV